MFNPGVFKPLLSVVIDYLDSEIFRFCDNKGFVDKCLEKEKLK